MTPADIQECARRGLAKVARAVNRAVREVSRRPRVASMLADADRAGFASDASQAVRREVYRAVGLAAMKQGG